MMQTETRIAVFKGKKRRKVLHRNEWWFVIVDVVSVLDSVQPEGYLKDMRWRDPELNKGWGQIATSLLVETFKKVNCLKA